MAPLTQPFRGTYALYVASGVGALGAGAWAFAWARQPERALYGYLTAYSFVLSVALGALFLLLIGLASGARWMSSIRRLAEATALALVPLALLFLPIASQLERLYVWAAPPGDLPERTRALIAHKAPYLNQPFFIARTALYFAIWIAAALTLARWSRQRDRMPEQSEGPEAALRRDRRFACVLLVPVSISATFAAYDWLMSLEPTWFSSAFGLYFFAGGFVAGIALVSLLACLGVQRGALAGLITAPHFHALGRLLFAFSIFWAYIAYFQAFLISIADRPNESFWYLIRWSGGSRALTLAVIAGQFVLPFLMLLPKALKLHPLYVGSAALLILVTHYFDVAWLVLPELMPDGVSFHWLDLAALCGVGGLSTAFCLRAQRGALPVAEGDPWLEAAIHYASTQ